MEIQWERKASFMTPQLRARHKTNILPTPFGSKTAACLFKYKDQII